MNEPGDISNARYFLPMAAVLSILPLLAKEPCCACEMRTQPITLAAARVARWLMPRTQVPRDPDLAMLKELDLSLQTQEVKKISDIRRLNLSYTPVKDSDMLTVAKAKNLEQLMLRNTSISDSGLQRISNLESLKLLDLADTRVTDNALIPLRARKHVGSYARGDRYRSSCFILVSELQETEHPLRVQNTRSRPRPDKVGRVQGTHMAEG